MRCVLHRLRVSEFSWNHLVICPKIMVRSFCNKCVFGLEIIILVSSANSTGVALRVIAFGKSLIYKRNKRGPKTDPCGTTMLYFSPP